MRGIKHQDLNYIMDFIYQGEAEMRKEELEDFLKIAGELGIKGMIPPGNNEEKEELNVEVSQPNTGKEDSEQFHQVVDKSHIVEMHGAILNTSDISSNIDEITGEKKKYKHKAIEEAVQYIYNPEEQEHEFAEAEVHAVAIKESFECDKCGKTYGSTSSLRSHTYSHIKKEQQTVDATFRTESPDETLSFDSINIEDIKTDLDKTLGMNVDLEEKINALTEKWDNLWHCIKCDKTNSSRFHLRRHVETHLEGFSFPCSSCGKRFPHRNALKGHVLKYHPELKVHRPFNCDICGKPSTSMIAVKIHKDRNHKNMN